MAKPGPKRKVSNLRLMMELYVAEDGAQFATQVQENVPLSTVQGVRDRLNEIVETTNYIEMSKVSGRNLYRLTDEGKSHVLAELRDRID